MIAKVVDALPGSGKTMSCINMINSAEPNKKFIFVTPYKTEVKRVESACVNKDFKSPSYKNNTTKLEDLHCLLEAGENIVSTHSLFMRATDRTRELLKRFNYTLVLDEVFELFQECNTPVGDIRLLIDKGIVKKEEDTYIWNYNEYSGDVFEEIVEMSKTRKLISSNNKDFFWMFPVDIFQHFEEIYILTYMFEHSPMRCCLDGGGVQYEYVGCKKESGIYKFCELSEMNRKVDLKSRVHIVKNPKRVTVGVGRTDLSSSWFDKDLRRGKHKMSELKLNIYNTFRHDMPQGGKKMWSTFKKVESIVKGKGYSNGFINFNQRATNDYCDRNKLAYCLNVFLNPNILHYANEKTENKLNQNMYALSVLVQWLFRSSVRRGEEVWVYIPSSRMRILLECWLDNLAKGKDLDLINLDPLEFWKPGRTIKGI